MQLLPRQTRVAQVLHQTVGSIAEVLAEVGVFMAAVHICRQLFAIHQQSEETHMVFLAVGKLRRNKRGFESECCVGISNHLWQL